MVVFCILHKRYPIKKIKKTSKANFFFLLCQQKQVFLRTAECRQCSIKTNLCILRTSFGLLPSFLMNAAPNILKCQSKGPIFLDNSQRTGLSISYGSNILAYLICLFGPSRQPGSLTDVYGRKGYHHWHILIQSTCIPQH